jgi:hypothetical protein
MSLATSPLARSLLARLGDTALRLLPPRQARLPVALGHWQTSDSEQEEILGQIQRLRGAVYVQDGAIPAHALDASGRHIQEVDDRSWHSYLVDARGTISGCIRVMPHAGHPRPKELHVADLCRRMEPATAVRHCAALQVFVDQARHAGLGVVEAGGTVVHPQSRNGSAALVLILACWSVSRLLGKPFALAAATVRHNAAEILLRTGGGALQDQAGELGGFFDPYYNCEMKIIAFDSRVQTRYELTVQDISRHLTLAPALAA